MNQIDDTVAALEALVSQHRKRLEANPDYRAIQTLERSVRELKAAPANGAPSDHSIFHNSLDAVAGQKLSQPGAAKQVILARGEPVPASELLRGVEALGVVVGGENKQRNLTSNLSNHKDFVSVQWRGGFAWWLKEKALPKGAELI